MCAALCILKRAYQTYKCTINQLACVVTALAHTPDGSVSATLMVGWYTRLFLPFAPQQHQIVDRLTKLTPLSPHTLYYARPKLQDPTGVRVQGCVHTELVEEYGPELAVGAVLLLAKARNKGGRRKGFSWGVVF